MTSNDSEHHLTGSRHQPRAGEVVSSDPLTARQSTGDGDEIVRFESVAVRVGGRVLWSQVDLSVRRGQFVAVLGPNGVGKSTMLKAVLGRIPVAAGTVTVLGSAPGGNSNAIGYVPQRRTFDSAARIRGRDIVRLGWDGHRWGVPMPAWLGGRAGAARVDEVIELVGAGAYADRPIGQCSGGEQQRLLIAQALVRRPTLLVLDEPLDSLDVTNQAAISALIENICRTEDVAVMMVAHDVNPILSYLDQVVYLSGGGAVSGSPEEIIDADILTALYKTPIDVLRDRHGRLVVVGQPDIPPEHGPVR